MMKTDTVSPSSMQRKELQMLTCVDRCNESHDGSRGIIPSNLVVIEEVVGEFVSSSITDI